jgi:AraC-like DNA-binding protein
VSAAFFGGRGFTLYHAWGSHGKLPLSPHFHDEYLICAQLRGHESCHVAGRLHEFSAGDVVLINPQQVHTGNAAAEEVEYVSLYVDRSVVAGMAEELGAATRSPEFTAVKVAEQAPLVEELVGFLEAVRAHGGSRLLPAPEPEHEHDVGATATGGSAPHLPQPLEVEEALRRVLLHAFEEFSNLRQPVLRSTNRVPHRKIARAVEYIRSLPTNVDPESVALEDLARVADLSKYHFLRQFDQVVGMTPGAYLRTLRLCHAARMLRTTQTPIVEIAVGVGFADHPSFSRAFARQMGMTPREYRRLGPL